MEGAGHHPEAADWQAWLAGEGAPAIRAEREAHLETCARCAAELERVRRTLLLLVAPDLDELSWRRLQSRVQAELDAPAPQRRPTRVLGRPLAIAAGLAGLGLIGALVLPRPEPSSPPPGVSAAAPLPPPSPAPPPVPRPPPTAVAAASEADGGDDAPLLSSGLSPFEVRLAAGHRLELSGHAEVRVLRDGAESVELALAEGQLEVRAPGAPSAPVSVTVQTPEFTVAGRSPHFVVGRWSDRAFVAVRAGTMAVRTAHEPERTVAAGERRRLDPPVETADPTVGPEPRPAPPRALAPPPARGRRPGSRSPVAAAPTDPVTRVSVLRAPIRPDPIGPDELSERWTRLRATYFEDGRAAEAVELAEALAADAGSRPEGRWALDLLCQAQLRLGAAERAVEACQRWLSVEPSAARAREIHRRLAHLYADRLGRCGDALDHFGALIVFGRASLLDEDALLGRARCALELGDLDLAALDLSVLEGQGNRVARRAEASALRRRLDAQRTPKGEEKHD
jgi:hypothetical protein